MLLATWCINGSQKPYRRIPMKTRCDLCCYPAEVIISIQILTCLSERPKKIDDQLFAITLIDITSAMTITRSTIHPAMREEDTATKRKMPDGSACRRRLRLPIIFISAKLRSHHKQNHNKLCHDPHLPCSLSPPRPCCLRLWGRCSALHGSVGSSLSSCRSRREHGWSRIRFQRGRF